MRALYRHISAICLLTTSLCFSTESEDFFRTQPPPKSALDLQLGQLLEIQDKPNKKVEENILNFFERNPEYSLSYEELIHFTDFVKTRILLAQKDRLYGMLLLDGVVA